MPEAIITALISAGASLIVAFGTWHFSMKKDREKQTEEVKELLIKHREEYLSGIQDVKNEVTSVKATVELNQALTNEKIDTLSFIGISPLRFLAELPSLRATAHQSIILISTLKL